MTVRPKLSLTMKIMIAMVAGIVLGVLINLFLADVAFVRETLVDGVLKRDRRGVRGGD